MTKYEEMPLNTIVKPGDRITVTITVPESGGWTVKPGIDDVKLIERPIPEVELPSVPGYYERVRFPVSGGYFAIRLDEHGKWHREGMRVTEEQLRVSYLPLTRLVPETAPVVDEAALAEVIHRAACGHKCKDESPMRVDHEVARAVADYLRGDSK